MMTTEKVIIRFPELTLDLGSICARELGDELMRRDPRITAEQQRDNKESQDFGTTLILLFETTAATAVAGGLAAWLRRTGTKIRIEDSGGTLIAENVTSDAAARIIEARYKQRAD